MSEIEIHSDKVHHVSRRVMMAASSVEGGVHPVEVLLGMAEALGRIIAAQEGTHLVHNDLLRLINGHVVNTVRASYSANGDNPEAIA